MSVAEQAERLRAEEADLVARIGSLPLFSLSRVRRAGAARAAPACAGRQAGGRGKLGVSAVSGAARSAAVIMMFGAPVVNTILCRQTACGAGEISWVSSSGSQTARMMPPGAVLKPRGVAGVLRGPAGRQVPGEGRGLSAAGSYGARLPAGPALAVRPCLAGRRGAPAVRWARGCLGGARAG